MSTISPFSMVNRSVLGKSVPAWLSEFGAVGIQLPAGQHLRVPDDRAGVLLLDLAE